MKRSQFLIIDDNEADAKRLHEALEKLLLFKSIDVTATLEEATSILENQSIDLIFLDILLTDQSGLKLLRSNTDLPPVIIVSSYPDYAIESYRIGKAADFIVKPFTEERLLMAVNRAMNFEATPNHITGAHFTFLKVGYKVQRFDFNAIDYVEAFGSYSKIFVDGQYTLINDRISVVKKLLPDQHFIQVHKSYIINTDKIAMFDRNNFWIQKTKIPIGISYRSSLESFLAVFGKEEEEKEK
ncbi:LytTR family two component transcriptional regulator [Spirosoma oryzae]|uniref:LytTR family two component transcriptional regulator n=1 Tax=Spirosoma oryzae TaxID=1469603 RepID=A0A2T0S0R3_9BACT|nr:LytTR family DNA-binding domain-containing protein [Spirosoma oryzae]PRY27019.1 LytTR family two component transcriptional regulator [Spirosoma oryzae]